MTKCTNQTKLFELSKGGMATSGGSQRYRLKDDIRYSHILNPKKQVVLLQKHRIQLPL